MYTYKRHGTRRYHGIIQNSRNVGKLSACTNGGCQALFSDFSNGPGYEATTYIAMQRRSDTLTDLQGTLCHIWLVNIARSNVETAQKSTFVLALSLKLEQPVGA